MDLRNRIRLVGNVGQAPQLRYNAQGSPVTDFRLAVDEPTQPGQEPSRLWFTVELWGRNAERACEIVTKGASVTVEGRFKLDKWKEQGTGHDRVTPVVASADFIVHKDHNRNGGVGGEPPA